MARSDREPERRAERRRPRRSTYAVEKSLSGSLDATAEGLEQLLRSLQGSGLVEGLGAYRTMQAILVQQKLWSQNHRRQLVMPKFRAIAKTAEELHRIFAGYASVMDSLRKLDQLTGATEAPRSPSSPARDPEVDASG